jgi:uncharacterized protein DUF3634
VELVLPLLLLAILTIPLGVAMSRANELFVLRVRSGAVRIARGRIPQRLLDDISDVVKGTGAADADIRAVVEGGRPAVYAFGRDLPQHLRQRLRNVISPWQVSQIRTAPRPRRS